MIRIIILIVVGVIIGVIVAFLISKILIKKHKRKIAKNSIEKILKQSKANFQTSEGKPVDLNFKIDGKEVDLEKQVKEELGKAKMKEIKDIERKTKEIEKEIKIEKKKKEVKKKKVKK